MNDMHFYDTYSLHFLWLVPNFRFVMVTFTPFCGIFTYFVKSSGTKHLLYMSILISTAIFLGSTTTGRPNRRCRPSTTSPICVFLVAESARSPTLRHQGQSVY